MRTAVALVFCISIAPLPGKAVIRASIQSPVSRKFEAASIKPCPADEQQPGPGRGGAGGTNATASPGRFYVPCVTLEQLVYLAYASDGARDDERLANDYPGSRSDDKKVRGGPDWVHSYKEKYAIEATAPGVSDRLVLMGTMLRALLEDRFQLKIHRESEDATMYVLRVAKSGFKLKPMQEADCDPNLAGARPPYKAEPCKSISQSGGSTSRLHFVGYPLSVLVRFLSTETKRHVIDETGVSGDFIVNLQFVSDNAPVSPGADPGSGPTLATALEEQLGLRLEKITGKSEFIVIDRAMKPRPDTP